MLCSAVSCHLVAFLETAMFIFVTSPASLHAVKIVHTQEYAYFNNDAFFI